MAESLESRYRDLAGILTGGSADLNVIRYAAAFAKMAKSRSLRFLTMPVSGEPARPPRPAAVRKSMETWGGKRLAGKAEILALESDDLDGVLRTGLDQGIDLMITGRRLPSTQFARTSFHQQLARKAPCDLFAVPPYRDPAFGSILVPIDFSASSARALKTAVALLGAAGAKSATIHAVHACSIPYGFSYTGDSERDFARQQAKSFRDQFRLFAREHRIPVSKVTFLVEPSEHPSRTVGEMALALSADLVIVGSRGKSRAATILLGSTAADLVARTAAPILVSKVKGETVGFLKALLGA